MIRSSLPTLVAVCLGWLLGLGQLAAPVGAAPVEPVVITLQKSVDVHHDIVVLGDIATVRGASPTMTRRLQGLDLVVLKNVGETQQISSRAVLARLLLDGVSRDALQLQGAAETTVILAPRSVPIPAADAVDYQADVLSQALNKLAAIWLVPLEDLEVQVLSSKTGLIAKDGSHAIPELELPSRPQPGRIQATVRWTSMGKIERLEQISLEARLRQTVVLAAHDVQRGQPLRPQDVVEERRLLATRVEQMSLEQVVGTAARRSIAQGELLNRRDLAAAQPVPDIRAKSLVRVVVRKKGVQVTLDGALALESGMIGDAIHVRNPEGNKVFLGKVVSSQVVEINLN